MKYNILVLILINISCTSPNFLDEEVVKKAKINSELAHESFIRSLNYTNAWLKKKDSVSGLIPSNLGKKIDIWDPANAAADNYPYMVLTAYVLDNKPLKIELLNILKKEKNLTSRLNSLPDIYSFSKKDFFEYPLNIGNIISRSLL